MTPDHEILSSEEWDAAHRVVSAWRSAPDAAHPCPRCASAPITLTDHSVRPYSEWYAIACAACGLRVTMHQPLSPPLTTPV